MLRLLTLALALANVLVFAWSQGHLGQADQAQREPQRMQAQLTPQRLVLLTQAQADAAQAAAAQAEAERAAALLAAAQAPVEPPPAPKPVLACLQAGPFTPADAGRFHTRLQALSLPVQAQRISVTHQEVTSRLVYLPPDGGREGAQRRAAELKQRGIDNYFIMQADSPLRWGISLGVFKNEGAAQKLLTQLQRKGVRGAKVLERGPQVSRNAYQWRAIDPALRGRIGQLAAKYSGASVTTCD